MRTVLIGQILVILGCIVYLVWWYRGFRPGTSVNRVGGINGALLLVTAVLALSGIALSLKAVMEIPSQLSQTNNRYKPYSVLGEVDDDKLLELLKDLEDSKTTLFSYHSNDPNVGMSLTKDISKFKIFCADTGLFVTLAFWDKDHTENIIYQKLLNDKLSTNLGYVYENIIAQVLAASGNKLFYYTWPKDETHNYEIDFLLSRGAKLHPIEVKSSGYKTHKSLDVFCEKYSHVVERRYLIYTKDLKKDTETLLLPVYMTQFL